MRGFLNYMQQNNVPLDFLSWHIYSNNPQDFANAAIFYRAELNARGYTATESHITEWNTQFRDPTLDDVQLRTGAKASSLMTAAWINLQNQNVAVSTFYRGTDPSMDATWFYGIFYANGTPKPVGLAFQLWKQMANHPKRSNVTLSGGNLSVLAGRNASGEFSFLISNPTAAPTSWQLALPPNASATLVKMQEIRAPATAISQTYLSGLSSTIDAYALQLVTVRLRKWQTSR